MRKHVDCPGILRLQAGEDVKLKRVEAAIAMLAAKEAELETARLNEETSHNQKEAVRFEMLRVMMAKGKKA